MPKRNRASFPSRRVEPARARRSRGTSFSTPSRRGARLRVRSVALVGLLLAICALIPGIVGQAANAGSFPTSRTFRGTPAIGTLVIGARGVIGAHFCTASVVNSRSGDVVLTAAHCVSSGADDLEFIPGYVNGRAPHGAWSVARIVVDSQWRASQNPNDDFAFLILKRRGPVSVQSLTGGEQVGFGDPFGRVVPVEGYPDGDSLPITCVNRVHRFSESQLEFDCNGFTDGTSGSPFLVDVNHRSGLGTVIGVIGGFEQGGTTPQVSYAARFGGLFARLYQAARRD
jgi:V8-like Glu-specific endopeptidase